LKQIILIGLFVMFGLTACGEGIGSPPDRSMPENMPGMGRGMGPGSGMMARHMASIPNEYAGLTNPVPPTKESVQRGQETYTTQCASCHGDGGMGDGPAGAALEPAPAPVAHTSQMMGDDYLFWRISEGGPQAPFSSAMPGWKASLDEQSRWDVINYIRALGAGQVTPRQQVGGTSFDPDIEAAQRTEMLAQAVEQGVITQAQAETFEQVHAALDAYRATQSNITGNMANIRDTLLPELVEAGEITQAQADAFVGIQDKLANSGLMQ